MKDAIMIEKVDQLVRLWVLLITNRPLFVREYSALTAKENGVGLTQSGFDTALIETRRYRTKKTFEGYRLTANAVATRNTMNSRLPTLWLYKSNTTLERLYRLNSAIKTFNEDYQEIALLYYADVNRTQKQVSEALGFPLRKVERAISSFRAAAHNCYSVASYISNAA